LQQVALQQLLLAVYRPALVTENGERPQHQYETGFLLVVLDNDKKGPLLHIAGVGKHVGRFLFQERTGLRPDEGDIDGVHKDKRNQQRKYLVDQLGGEVLSHGKGIPVIYRPGTTRHCRPRSPRMA
jgi:hypothetical protein